MEKFKRPRVKKGEEGNHWTTYTQVWPPQIHPQEGSWASKHFSSRQFSRLHYRSDSTQSGRNRSDFFFSSASTLYFTTHFSAKREGRISRKSCKFLEPARLAEAPRFSLNFFFSRVGWPGAGIENKKFNRKNKGWVFIVSLLTYSEEIGGRLKVGGGKWGRKRLPFAICKGFQAARETFRCLWQHISRWKSACRIK